MSGFEHASILPTIANESPPPGLRFCRAFGTVGGTHTEIRSCVASSGF